MTDRYIGAGLRSDALAAGPIMGANSRVGHARNRLPERLHSSGDSLVGTA